MNNVFSKYIAKTLMREDCDRLEHRKLKNGFKNASKITVVKNAGMEIHREPAELNSLQLSGLVIN